MKRTLFRTLFLVALYPVTFLAPVDASGRDLMQLYLDITESSADVFESIWEDDSARIPNSGFFDFRKYPDWRDDPYATIIVIPGNGMVQFCYAVLMTETEKQEFGEKRIPRDVLLRHAIQSIRWCCLTSSYVEKPYPYLPNTRKDFADGPNWRRQHSWRADEIGWMTLAAAILWDELDTDTQKQVSDVLTGGAPRERLSQTWYPPQGGNHDQVKQDLSSTMGAAYLLRKHPDAKLYYNIISGNGIDMVSTQQDFANSTLAGDTPVSAWAKGWNLYPDYSSDHHGWCNLWYGSDLIFEGLGYIDVLSKVTGLPIPETFTYPGNGFDGVLEWLKVLCLPEGEPLSPHGNEYDTYYGASLLAYCYGATVKKDPVAAALEERAADLLQRHSRAIRAYDYHRNSWAKAAMAYLLHKYNGPRIEPLSYQEAAKSLQGVYHYRWLQNLIHRSDNKIASFSWGSISSRRNVNTHYGNGLCGFISPAMREEHADAFVYCHPKSLIGDFQITESSGQIRNLVPPETIYHTRMDDGNFFTAGYIPDPVLDRYYAFHSFDHGPSVFFTLLKAKTECHVTWSGLPTYFYVRDGLTGERNLHTSQGVVSLGDNCGDIESNWWCVDGRLGAVFEDKSTTIRTQRSAGYNWARKETYRDQCDAIFISPLQNMRLNVNQEFFLPVVFHTNTPERQIKRLNHIKQDSLSVPKGWFTQIAEDPVHEGKRYFSIANFYSAENQAVLKFTDFDEGSPILSAGSTITNKAGYSIYPLNALETAGEVINLYVETLDGKTITAIKIRDDVYKLIPQEPGLTSIRLRYRGGKNLSLLPQTGIEEHQVDNTGEMALIKKLLDDSNDRVDLSLEEPLIIDLSMSPLDQTGPAVEITNILIREDNRITIEAAVGDRSGINSAVLYCDGEIAGKKTNPPFIWTHRPGVGYHTYHVIATDGSQNQNQRVSFKRTVRVGEIEN